jgi:hypothetical protein
MAKLFLPVTGEWEMIDLKVGFSVMVLILSGASLVVLAGFWFIRLFQAAGLI